MRKALYVVACTLMLTSVGVSQASIDAPSLRPFADSVVARLHEVGAVLQYATAENNIRLQTSFDTAASGARKIANAQARPDNEGNHAMLIAGLMIMGVIIRRRYGSRE